MSTKNPEKITNRQLFSQRFRKLRKRLGLSQRQLAKKLNFTANTQVSKFETAASEPTLETLRQIAKFSEVDLHKLVTGKPCPALKLWQEENKKLLELLARYVSHETGRLLQERHKLWGELGVAQEKQGQGITGQDEYVSFLRSELARIEKLLADAAEDQHYVQEALNGIGC